LLTSPADARPIAFQPSLRDYSFGLTLTQDFILGYFQPSLRDYFVGSTLTQDFILGYFQPSLRDYFVGSTLTQDFILGYFQPSLRDYSFGSTLTQDFILGYFQSSLRDWFPCLAEIGEDPRVATQAKNGWNRPPSTSLRYSRTLMPRVFILR
jgi:hypothetical protein